MLEKVSGFRLQAPKFEKHASAEKDATAAAQSFVGRHQSFREAGLDIQDKEGSFSDSFFCIMEPIFIY